MQPLMNHCSNRIFLESFLNKSKNTHLLLVSNSVLTDKGTSSEKKKYNYTGIRPEQFWGKTTIHGVLIYQYGSPNNPKQVHCKAAQNAVPTHDAMIASSGTGTAGPLMGTMHSP